MKKLFVFIPLLILFATELRAQGGGGNDASFNLYDDGVNVNGGADSYIQALDVQPDGKILIAGSFTKYNNITKNVIMRLNADGTVDGTFNQGGIQENAQRISKIICQPDGKILLCGPEFRRFQGTIVNRFTRLLADGSLDTDFNTTIVNNLDSYDPPFSPDLLGENMVLQPDGKIILVGRFNKHGTNTSKNIMRINNDGSFDPTFNVGAGAGEGYVTHVNLLPDGRVFIYSPFITEYNGTPIPGCAILNSDGTLNAAFTSTLLPNIGENDARSLIGLPNGKMYLIGGDNLYTQNALTYRGIVRLNADLTLDPSFSFTDTIAFGSQSFIGSAIPLPGGKIIIGGRIPLTKIVRLNEDGTVDQSFNTGTGFSITLPSEPIQLIDGIKLLANNKLLVHGLYYLYNGSVRHCLMRVNNSEDEPCDATEIIPSNPGQSSCSNAINGDVGLATFNSAINVCNVATNDIWYSFTATGTSHIVKATGNGDFQPAITVYSGSSCNALNAGNLGCRGNNTTVSLALSGLTPGLTYFIRVCSSSYITSTNTSFSICVLTPANDEPCDAITLTAGPSGTLTCTNPVPGDVSLATNSGLVTNVTTIINPSTGNATSQTHYNNDLWYKFVATQSTYLVRLDQDGDFRSTVNLFSSNDCNNPGTRIQNDNSYSQFLITRYSELVIGNTYYLQVSARDTIISSTTFSICLLTPPPHDEICGAIDLPNLLPLSINCSNEQSGNFKFATYSGNGCTGEDFWYSFTATHTTHVIKTSNVADIAVYTASSCNGPLTQVTCRAAGFTVADQKAVPLKNLVIGTTYYIAISRFTFGSNGGTNDFYTICQTAVENDEPCGAISLSNCTPIQVDAAFGTNTLNSTCESITSHEVIQGNTITYEYDDVQLKDLWYKFTATTTRADLVVSGPNLTGLFALRLTLRFGTVADCNNPATINILDDCIQLYNTTLFTVPLNGLTIGQQYYIAVSNGDKDLREVLYTDFTMELRTGSSAISISANPAGSLCSGTPVTFTATPTNGGSNPTYEWKLNNQVVGTGDTYSSSSLSDNDIVACKLTSSNCVAPASVSQSVTMDIYPIPTWYADADGDGFGNASVTSITNCVQPVGYVSSNNDCDDADDSVFPGSISKNIYRSKQSGNWSSYLTWEYFDGCYWKQTPGFIPSATDSSITITHEVTVISNSSINANEISIQNGRLNIYGVLNLVDAPGEDLLVGTGSLLYMDQNGLLSGTGTALVTSDIIVYSAARIAVQLTNQGVFNFSQSYGGCCIGGQLFITDGTNSGTILNDGIMIITASGGGVNNMLISGGTFHNRTGGQVKSAFDKVTFEVNQFINDGQIIAGTTNNLEGSCNISSTLSATHNGRFSSNNLNKIFNITTGGTFNYAPSSVIEGNVHFTGGIHNINSQYNAMRTHISTQVNFLQPEVNFNAEVVQDGGEFSGPAIKKINSSYAWWAGTLSGAALQIAVNAFGHFGVGQTSLGTLAGTIVNNGTINLVTGYGGCCVGPIFNMTNGTIENNGQFIFSPTGGGGIYNETLSGGTFNNNVSGTLINNQTTGGGYGDNEIYLRNNVFTNTGTILSNAKSLNIFPTTNPTLSGTITTAAGCMTKLGTSTTTTTLSPSSIINGAGTIYFTEGNHQVNSNNYNPGATLSGMAFSAAFVDFNQAHVDLNYVNIISGRFGGPATKLVKDDLFVGNAVEITGGAISNTDTGYIGFSSTTFLKTSLTNNGSMGIYPYYQGCCGAGSFNMTNGGTLINNKNIHMDAAGGIYHVGIYDGNFINNATGVISTSYQSYIKPATFSNSGTINVLNSTLELNAFTIGGILNINPGTELRATGTLIFNGSLINNNGNITAPFDFMNASAKTLKGNGTFSSNIIINNAATVTPGSSPGILTVAGNYTQGEAALNIEIGGNTPGPGHDRLAVTGTAMLSGTLNATEINGYDPQTLTTIDIITAAGVTGTFGTVNLPPSWTVKYFSNKVSLVKFFMETYYADADGDGFGNPAVTQLALTQPAGYVLNNADCNDNNASVYPGATEICDGLDNDCDGYTDAISNMGVVCGTADEGFSFTLTAPAGKVFTAVNFASYGNPNGSCNNFSIGSCHASNSLAIVQGIVLGQNSVSIPATNGLFGDPCGGTIKRLYVQATYGEVISLTQTYYNDADGDGFGNPAISQLSCSPPTGYVSNNTDCDDTNNTVYPGAVEICDGLDNNCDGMADTTKINGLVLYLPLNGNATDFSGNGLHGTINGSVTPTADRFGNANAAMFFPGNIASHIRINDNALLRPSSISLSAWVNMSSQPGHGSFITKSINCYNDSWHFGSQGGNYSTWVSNSTVCGDFVQMVSPNSTGVWRHVVFTLDEATDSRKMYVDGNLVATGSYTSTIPYDGNPVLIGTAIESGSLDFPLHGMLDEVMIFNRAISAAEVSAFFNNSSPITGLNTSFYADADGDGFGNPSVTTTVTCGSSAPTGYVSDNTDCDDSNADLYPGIIPGTVTGTTALCIGTTITYTSNGNTGGTWTSANDDVASVNPTTGLVTANSTGTTSISYTVITCSGPQSASQTITVNEAPIANPVSNQSVNNGSSTTAINFSGTGTSYTWVNNNTSISLAASGTGNIPSFTAINTGVAPAIANITVTPVNTVNSLSCTGSPVNFTITVLPAAFTMNTVPDQVLCAQTLSSPVVFSSSTAGVTYNWTNSDPSISLDASGTGDIPSFLVQNAGLTDLQATITVTPSIPDGNGGNINGTPVSFTIRVNHTPKVNAMNNVTFCRENTTDPIIFTGAATSFTWTNDNINIGLAANGTGDIPAFTATNAFLSTPMVANIQVKPYTNDGITCQGNSEIFTITVNPKPIMNNVANRIVCDGNTVTVSFSGVEVTQYAWLDNGNILGLPQSGTGNIASQVFNVSSTPYTSTITVTPRYINNITCPGDPKNFTITVNPTPGLDPVPDQRLCLGQITADINFSSDVSGATFDWTNSVPAIGLPANGSGNIPSFTTSGSGNSNVSVRTSANGCLGGIRNFSIIVDPIPSIDPVENITVCSNQGGAPIIFSPGNGNYTWTNSNPAIGLAGSGTGIIPSWGTINTGANPISGTITVINSNGSCSSEPITFTLTVNPLPVVDPSFGITQFCDQIPTNEIVFNGNFPGLVYNWTNSNTIIGLPANGTGNIPSFTPNVTGVSDAVGNITVTGELLLNGIVCTSSPRFFPITIKMLPTVNAVTDKFSCNGSTVGIDFTATNSIPTFFTWTNNNSSIGLATSGIGNIPEFIATNNGTTPIVATITVTPHRNLVDNFNCDGQSQTFTITVMPSTTINSVANQIVCPGTTINEIVFTGTIPGTIIEWTNNNPTIGLAANGTGNIPSFTATNVGYFEQFGMITVRTKIYAGLLNGIPIYCSGESFIFQISVKGNPEPPVITANGITNICQGQSVILTSNVSGTWSDGSFGAILLVNTTGTYFITQPGNGCGQAVSNSITVTVTPISSPTVLLTASANPSCPSAPVTFTANVNNASGVLSYEWFVGNIATITNTNIFTTSNLNNGNIVQVRVTSNAPCSNSALSNAIVVNRSALANAGTILGLSTLASGFTYPFTSNGNQGGVWSSSNNAVLTIDPVTGISTTVNPGVATISYTLLTGCGAPRLATKQVEVVNITTPIIGADYVCPQSSSISYSLAPSIPSGGTWSISNASMATFVVQPGTDRIISLIPLSTGTLTIFYALPGNNIISKDIQIMIAPIVGSITGPRNLCEFYGTNNTFTYSKELALPITGYQWIVPGSLTIVGGQGTNNLVVRLSPSYSPSQSYSLRAIPVGFGCPAVNEITGLLSTSPQTPSLITPLTNDICSYIGTNNPVTYTIPKVASATSYIWTAQSGTTTITHPNGQGINDTTVTVMFSSGFTSSNISVVAVNGCGASSPRSLTINKTNPATPGNISGPTNTCNYQLPIGSTATYSIPLVSGMTYNWAVPAGISSFNGQGTNSISFRFPSGFTTGTIIVTATNGCGTSAARTLSVGTLYPAAPGVIDVIQLQACPNRIYSYTIASMPTNSQFLFWTVPTGATLLSGQGTTSIQVAYPNTSFAGKVEVYAISNCRSSVTRTTSVKLPACPPVFAGKGTPKTDIEKNSTTTFSTSLYPNPTQHDFNLTVITASSEIIYIQIWDMQGRIVQKLKLPAFESTRIGAALKAGVYQLEVRQGKQVSTQRIVKY